MGAVNNTTSSVKQSQNQNSVAVSTFVDNADSSSGKDRVTTISSEVLEYMDIINELLNTTEAQQIAFINKIEV